MPSISSILFLYLFYNKQFFDHIFYGLRRVQELKIMYTCFLIFKTCYILYSSYATGKTIVIQRKMETRCCEVRNPGVSEAQIDLIRGKREAGIMNKEKEIGS